MNLYISLKKANLTKEVIAFENVDSELSVAELKVAIAQKASLENPQCLQLIYLCNPLKDTSNLRILEETQDGPKVIYASVQLQSTSKSPRILNSTEQHQFVLLFRAALANLSFRQILQDISKPESIKQLLKNVPGLKDDCVAISMLHDWELLLHLADPEVVSLLAKKHPALVDSVSQILTSIPNASPSAHNSYRRSQQSEWLTRPLGGGAENENINQMENLQGPLNQPTTQNSSSSLTPAQLATALNLAQNSTRQSLTNRLSSPQPSGTNSHNNQLSTAYNPVVPSTSSSASLTPEMLSQALFQAMSQIAQSGTPRTSRLVSNAGTIDSSTSHREETELRQQFSRHLPQMRELGITDDNLSLRALQATNGDVEAAVNLIYAGLVDD